MSSVSSTFLHLAPFFAILSLNVSLFVSASTPIPGRLLIDLSCSMYLEWWGAQSLFTFLGSETVMPPGTAFGMGKEQYFDIIQGAERSRKAFSTQTEEGKANLKLDTTVYSDSGSAAKEIRPFGGWFPQGFVIRVRKKAEFLGREVLNYELPIGGGSGNEVEQQMLIGDMIYYRSQKISSPTAGIIYGWRRIHKDFCYEILENLIYLIVNNIGENGVRIFPDFDGEIEDDLSKKQIKDLDPDALLRKTQEHFLILSTMASFDIPQTPSAVGVKPEILKPILSTLAYLSQRWRQETFRECLTGLVENSHTDTAIGDPSDLSTTHETCHSSSIDNPLETHHDVKHCCNEIKENEGPVISDSWRAYIRNEPLNRDLRAEHLYSMIRQKLWKDATFRQQRNVTMALRETFVTLPEETHVSQRYKFADENEVDLVLLDYFMTSSTSFSRSRHLERNAGFKILLPEIYQHRDVVSRYLRTPLFPVLEEILMPEILRDVVVVDDYLEVVAAESDNTTTGKHGACEGKKCAANDSKITISDSVKDVHIARTPTPKNKEQTVPEFLVLPKHDLVSDSVRRKRALHCPLNFHDDASTYGIVDIFLEIGGFLGDCAVSALFSGMTKVGVVEIDASKVAINQFNRTMERIQKIKAEDGEKDFSGFFVHAEATFVSNQTGLFAREEVDRNDLVSDAFFEGANGFSGAQWRECRRSSKNPCVRFKSADEIITSLFPEILKRKRIQLKDTTIQDISIGLRIKVAGTEHHVLASAAKILDKMVAWVHVTILPECDCEGEVMRLLREHGFDVGKSVLNQYNERIVVGRKKRS